MKVICEIELNLDDNTYDMTFSRPNREKEQIDYDVLEKALTAVLKDWKSKIELSDSDEQVVKFIH